MAFFNCNITPPNATKISSTNITQTVVNRGVGTSSSLTLQNDSGLVIMSLTSSDGGNFSYSITDNDHILTLIDNQVYNDSNSAPRGGILIYSFEDGKGKTIGASISYPNNDWAYRRIVLYEIS